jgi:toxin ParE1/3/4
VTRLVVSKAALGDLKIIARYTEREWGQARKTRYLAILRERFAALLKHPQLGMLREDLAAGYRSLPAGRHVIFYRLTNGDIVVLRVLHQRMDVKLHL